jgi:hypothetical protein
MAGRQDWDQLLLASEDLVLRVGAQCKSSRHIAPQLLLSTSLYSLSVHDCTKGMPDARAGKSGLS